VVPAGSKNVPITPENVCPSTVVNMGSRKDSFWVCGWAGGTLWAMTGDEPGATCTGLVVKPSVPGLGSGPKEAACRETLGPAGNAEARAGIAGVCCTAAVLEEASVDKAAAPRAPLVGFN